MDFDDVEASEGSRSVDVIAERAGETLYWVMTVFHLWKGSEGRQEQSITSEKFGPFAIGRANAEREFWESYAREGLPARTWLVPAETPTIEPKQQKLL